MSHAALVNDGLLWFLVFLTLLLVMFVYAVIRMPPEPAPRTARAHTARAHTARVPGDATATGRRYRFPRRRADRAPCRSALA